LSGRKKNQTRKRWKFLFGIDWALKGKRKAWGLGKVRGRGKSWWSYLRGIGFRGGGQGREKKT